MHLLAATPGRIAEGDEAVDLRQTPGRMLFLSAADSELACLAAARRRLPAAFPSLRLANLLQLSHPLSVDLYAERVVQHAELVVVRLLGGIGYWPYGVERLVEICRRHNRKLALLPGDDRPDPELQGQSTLPAEALQRLWDYARYGGVENAVGLLRYGAGLLGAPGPSRAPEPLPHAGLYRGGAPSGPPAGTRTAALIFYRALLQAGDLAAIDALCEALAAQGLRPLPIYVSSLKDPDAWAFVEEALGAAPPQIILNATAFATGSLSDAASAGGPLAAFDCPVLQVVLAGRDREAWRADSRGLTARDVAMHVALPEVDGRLLTRAVAFKSESEFDPLTETAVIRYAPEPDRIGFVARLAAAWVRLRRTPPADRRIAVVLANYPNRDSRIGNGVGLDTPAGVLEALRALARAGYAVGDPPEDGDALIARLLQAPSNAHARAQDRRAEEQFSLAAYEQHLAGLPAAVAETVVERWGPPEDDPFFREGALDCGVFRMPAVRFGNVLVAVQPARGYNLDPKSSYHDPALPPPHGYLAFYAWLQREFDAHAVVHFGKHGNLEWLPGKALALSASCFPEAALGALPHLYPFIVNDPGEGSQAKRRSAAAIVDHLIPPLSRAESYGPQRELELLIDEYYEAAGLDPRRLAPLAERILDLCRASGLDRDCGIADAEATDSALGKLDGYLCELKEMQIRDGLHVFGRSPTGPQRAGLLCALLRLPRGDGLGGNASLHRALAQDLGLDGFDPLDADMAAPWAGRRPAALAGEGPWRTAGDTVERLEALALALVSGERQAEPGWRRSEAVLRFLESRLRPLLDGCGEAELAGLLRGLDGRFLPPGPSGAPSRGRLEVLPTGRNFYSVDCRAVPTPAAWQLGWLSAMRLVERHAQEHGSFPRSMALSAWGTANMRTGGDDLAQALALMGVQPTWEPHSGRVTGFEIIPLSLLDRPRVDVTLRISGFFRDAFPAQIALFDSAVRAVAALQDEGARMNPLADRVAQDAAALQAEGLPAATARRRAEHRVFGSKPGAYGAGLQALFDERLWQDERDLVEAYVAWGGYLYGGGEEGAAAPGLLRRRLASVEAVLHNQDNREHDLLDSDDYYQFEGGLTAAVRVLSGRQPAAYHNDHSRPESPKVRTLEEEIARTVRARVVNPKWIAGVMRHGYKGAFEMAATVDYLFAFAATSRAVAGHHFELVFDAYVADPEVAAFLAEHNPAARRDIADRLLEAQDRGLWQPRRNDTREHLRAILQGEGRAP